MLSALTIKKKTAQPRLYFQMTLKTSYTHCATRTFEVNHLQEEGGNQVLEEMTNTFPAKVFPLSSILSLIFFFIKTSSTWRHSLILCFIPRTLTHSAMIRMPNVLTGKANAHAET